MADGEAGRIATLSQAMEALSACTTMEEISREVRTAARALTAADGITVVLRESRMVRYVDEDAISPLWKGQAFPIAQCISGLAMLGRETIVIADVFADARVPHEFYRKTFVKSMAMAPVRKVDPIAAIGAYWATVRTPTPIEIACLEGMAQAASLAIEMMDVRTTLARRDLELRAS